MVRVLGTCHSLGLVGYRSAAVLSVHLFDLVLGFSLAVGTKSSVCASIAYE